MERKVIIYTQVTCNPCQEQKAWMKEKAILFEERDVREKEEYFNEAVSLGATSTPVTIVAKNGIQQVIKGFDREKLEHVLQLD